MAPAGGQRPSTITAWKRKPERTRFVARSNLAGPLTLPQATARQLPGRRQVQASNPLSRSSALKGNLQYVAERFQKEPGKSDLPALSSQETTEGERVNPLNVEQFSRVVNALLVLDRLPQSPLAAPVKESSGDFPFSLHIYYVANDSPGRHARRE